MAETAYPAFEAVPGALDAGALIVCDHASNAIPPHYGTLGLEREALERHIAYDIGAADVTRALAEMLGAPAVLSTYSRLIIDPNRSLDDPTLVMRYSDGAIVPGNARLDEVEVARRRDRYWRPYRAACIELVERMGASGRQPTVLSIHSFTPYWRGRLRPWKVGVLWDMDSRLPKPLLERFSLSIGMFLGVGFPRSLIEENRRLLELIKNEEHSAEQQDEKLHRDL